MKTNQKLFEHFQKNLRPLAYRALAALAVLTLAVQMPLRAQTTSATPKLAAAVGVGQKQQMRWRLRGQPDAAYVVQASTNMVNWTDIANVLTGTNGIATFTDPLAGGAPARYYRSVANSATVAATSYSSGRILVKPISGVNVSSLNLTLGVNVLRTFPAIGNLQIIKVPSGTTAAALIAAYQKSGLVVYAEPDYILHALAMPNDPHFQQGDQWGLWNEGQYGGTAGADIDATNAWDIQHDAGNIIVAEVDTGVRYTHEDLASEMWHNPEENQDGYTNDLYGINLTDNGRGNGDPWDDYGHGTFVAGVIGAVGNNGLGVVGVAWDVQIMALKFLDTNGDGTIGDAVTCLDFARTHGANIVNASWGTTNFDSQALHDAIASLRDAGIMFVAAAGNSGADNEVSPIYPASYSDLDNVIAVAATDRNDDLTSWSDYGATNVDLAAPGADIFSCWNGSDSDYESGDGTSFSAPMVSGAAAVMEAHFPNENYLQIKQQIMANVDPLPSLQGKCISGGRLNLYKALGGTNPPPTLAANFSANPTSGQVPLAVQFTDASTGNPSSWDWNFGDGSADSTTQNPSHTFNNAGSYTVTLTVADSSNQTSSASQTITATSGTNAAPVITLTATQPNAYVSGQQPGVINFHRTGDTSQAYEVYWSFSGTATNGVDYGSLPTNSPFPAGQSDATLTITPINHGQTNDETVTVTLMPGSAYQAGSPGSATVVIHGLQPAAGPTASFTANPTSGQSPLTVQFTDTSSGSPVSWNWNFGDGATSTTQNPSHTFSNAGNYNVTLTVADSSNQTSSASQTITVTNATTTQPVTANFAANPNSGQAPLAVQFTDQSTGPVTAWSWNFGDGATSTTQNPSHTYSSAGTFTAALIVTGSSGQTSSTSHMITVTNTPVTPVTASFSANPSSGQSPLTVQFTDQSSGPVTAWSWNFGDGATSSAQNPSHTYSGAGIFTAALTVTGGSGQTSSTSRTITVTNAPPPPSSTVTVVASQPLASILSPGVFTITRTGGGTGSALTVDYSLGGSAQNGVDYQTLGGSAVIPAGSSSTTVVVRPEGLLTILKTVALTLSPDSGYNVGSPKSATVTILVQAGG